MHVSCCIPDEAQKTKAVVMQFCTIHLLNLGLHEFTQGTSIAVTSMTEDITVHSVCIT